MFSICVFLIISMLWACCDLGGLFCVSIGRWQHGQSKSCNVNAFTVWGNSDGGEWWCGGYIYSEESRGRKRIGLGFDGHSNARGDIIFALFLPPNCALIRYSTFNLGFRVCRVFRLMGFWVEKWSIFCFLAFHWLLHSWTGAQMDGYEATRQIRKWEVEKCDKCGEGEFQSSHVLAETNIECKHNRLPIVAVTADVMKETHELCYTAGMDDYITKVPQSISLCFKSQMFFHESIKKIWKKKIFVFWVCLFPGTCLELCQHLSIESNTLFKVAYWVYAKLTPICFSKILKYSLWRLRDPWVPASEFLLVPARLGYCPHSQGFKPFEHNEPHCASDLP